jgi:hypothetical protein
MRLVGGEVEVARAALGVEAALNGKRLQQGGLARAVLPYEECHGFLN